MKICDICGAEFENSRVYSNHVRWKHLKISFKRLKCIHCKKDVCEYKLANHVNACVHNPLNIKNCVECGKQVIGYRKKFCNSSCSAKHTNKNTLKDYSYITEEWRETQRQHAIAAWNRGVHKLNTRYFTSKNEREIVKVIKTKFPDDEWKSGGRLPLGSNLYLSRDLWSDKLKVCVEYDGIWHFKDIHNQLQLKQQKDKLLKVWCEQNNYRLIRIDEDNYINVDQVINAIYQQTDKLILIGDRY